MLDVSRLFSLWFVLSVSVSLTLLQCALAGGKQRNAHRWNGRADETRALRADESAARKATAECVGEPQASSAVAYCVVRGRYVLDVSQRLSVSFVFSVSVSPICGWQTACQQNRGGANTFGGRLHLILPHTFLCTLLTTFDVDS